MRTCAHRVAHIRCRFACDRVEIFSRDLTLSHHQVNPPTSPIEGTPILFKAQSIFTLFSFRSTEVISLAPAYTMKCYQFSHKKYKETWNVIIFVCISLLITVVLCYYLQHSFELCWHTMYNVYERILFYCNKAVQHLRTLLCIDSVYH